MDFAVDFNAVDDLQVLSSSEISVSFHLLVRQKDFFFSL